MKRLFEEELMELQNLGSICRICNKLVGHPVAFDERRIPIDIHLKLEHDIYISDENLRSRTMWYTAKQRVLR